jgi:hypothetical protein
MSSSWDGLVPSGAAGVRVGPFVHWRAPALNRLGQ